MVLFSGWYTKGNAKPLMRVDPLFVAGTLEVLIGFWSLDSLYLVNCLETYPKRELFLKYIYIYIFMILHIHRARASISSANWSRRDLFWLPK